MKMVLTDSYGREALNLRISITDDCNLRCSYCHMEGEERKNKKEMSVDEIIHLSKIAVSLGMKSIKITGGEPLMRKDILEIVKGISSIPNLEDLSMTTNATLLAPLSKELKKNGLKRVNINLPTIKKDVYHQLTGGNLEDALLGVKSAVESGFYPVKINMLLLRGINENDVMEMMEFAKRTTKFLQLIELEPINLSNDYYLNHYKSLEEYEDFFKQRAEKIEIRKKMQNRSVYYLPSLKVEFVRSSRNANFCANCTRLRITSDGKLKPCLMRNDNLVDILTAMRNHADDSELIEMFKIANQRRAPYYK